MKKYIFATILFFIIFIGINVSAAEYQSNQEMMKTAAETLRDKMLNRESGFYITTKYIAEKYEIFSPKEYGTEIFNKAVSEELAVNPSCGDYLEVAVAGKGITLSGLIDETLEDGKVLYTIRYAYTFNYHTTKEQEGKLDRALTNWVRLNIDNEASEFDKIFKIYKYIADNVDYDYTYEKYTAYDAFFEGSSVCQGYAQLFYKMCKFADLDGVRLLIGWAEGGSDIWDRHAWNSVKLDGKYYYLDPTWDGQGTGETLRYMHFLRGAGPFEKRHDGTKPEGMEQEDYCFFTTEQLKIDVNNRKINGFDISGGTINKDELLKKINLKENSINIEIQSEKEIIGTGASVIIKKDNMVLDEYGIVIYGDINGDGKITAYDALNLIKGINGRIYFEATYPIEAGRIITSGKNKPKAVDALAIIKHVNGKYIINQSK